VKGTGVNRSRGRGRGRGRKGGREGGSGWKDRRREGLEIYVAILANATENYFDFLPPTKQIVFNTFYTNFATRFL
jgi:hypothetical protein